MINKHNYSIEQFNNSPLVTADLVKKNNKIDISAERSVHLDHSLELEMIEGEILEFGVFSGVTINKISDKFKNQTIHGFDSFEGLPEDWAVLTKHQKWPEKIKHKKGYFSVEKLPEVNGNVKLWKGWFNDTIPQFLNEVKVTSIKFLHVDCDLYSSTKTIFDSLNEFIVPGTIIVFDEFYPWGHKRYETWMEHEYKALKEWIEKFDREIEVISHNMHQQCCIRILK